ncbi:MAG: hypothetical protein LBK07_05715, partial [Tannerella sp.]|nr:hypothetical protein [Tannerella sp.]
NKSKKLTLKTVNQFPSANLKGRQDMVTWRYVLPFRQQIWRSSCPRRSLTRGYENTTFQVVTA